MPLDPEKVFSLTMSDEFPDDMGISARMYQKTFKEELHKEIPTVVACSHLLGHKLNFLSDSPYMNTYKCLKLLEKDGHTDLYYVLGFVTIKGLLSDLEHACVGHKSHNYDPTVEIHFDINPFECIYYSVVRISFDALKKMMVDLNQISPVKMVDYLKWKNFTSKGIPT